MKKPPRKKVNPPQHQPRPGMGKNMHPEPVVDNHDQTGSNKLKGKIALITGGDSGIGKAVAILFAKEGADLAIAYLNEHKDAADTKQRVELYGRKCLLIPGDISKEKFCNSIVKKTITAYGRIDILVNNAAIHYECKKPEDLETKKILRTFQVNIFSMIFITRAAVAYMDEGSTIINSSSVTAYRGSPELIDYAATKGAIVAFTRSLATNLMKRKIRVNGVAPGPIWTPLIASSFKPKKVAAHGSTAPMERVGEPVEVAPSYLFLSSADSSYMSGQFLHPNGGEIVNG
ncbi:MAG TPA: SDR family oxidoreductase [Chitinophagaceae bacterium]|nr:SDR family oxidoreductase [Chitinophagaceae bacterium]